MKTKPSEIKKMVLDALQRTEREIDDLQDESENPSVRKLFLRAEGRKEALDAVLCALHENPVNLKILAGK